MAYLIATNEIYRVDNEREVERIIDEAKTDNRYMLGRYKCAHKEKKVKGEIVDEWFHLELYKIFDEEKEPCGISRVYYTNSSEDVEPVSEDIIF